MKLLYNQFPCSGKFIPFIFLFPFLVLYSSSLAGQCCTTNPILDNSFEAAISVGERFPDAVTTATNNALTYDPTNWTYADGTYALNPTVIDDVTRASAGDQFSYIPNPGGTPTYNKCLGTGLNYTSTYTCQSGSYTTNVRYIASFDYIPFNKDVPTGGTGNTQPKFEYSYGSLTEINLYNNAGTLLNSNETAVAWNDVATSWKTAYGLVPASTSNGGLVLWFSHDRFGTCGMLLDNTDLEMIELTAHGLSGIAKGANTSEITFSLNPASNVVGIPNLSYEVEAPAGYTVNPTTGNYNPTTNFTLTINSGDMISGGGANIDLAVRDEVNTNCEVTATISNL